MLRCRLRLLSAVVLAWAHLAQAQASTPAEAAAIADADCKRLPVDAQLNVRYLWAGMWTGPQVRQVRYHTLNLLVHQASREADFAPIARVAEDVWRLDYRNYRWLRETYEKLAEVDPYFHAKAVFTEVAVIVQPAAVVPAAPAVPAPVVGKEATASQDVQAYTDEAMTQLKGTIPKGLALEVTGAKDGKVELQAQSFKVWAPQGAFTYPEPARPKEEPKPAPTARQQEGYRYREELSSKALADLVARTQSQTPLLRADWFAAQISRQIDINNQQVVGYYDFLQVKEEADLEALAGLDRKTADKLRREIRAIIKQSGVALKGRQVAVIDRGYWESLDVDNVQGRQNPVRQLGRDFKPKAKEVYFRLPCDLWGTAAVNAADGKLAASVPDSIAGDSKTTSNDRRIHPQLSCVRCHAEGLRPLDDWARQFYANPPGDFKLAAVADYEKLKELRQLYLRPIEDRYEDDQRVYARALLRLTGMTPEAAAKAVRDFWKEYADEPVTGERLARELGVSHAHMLAGFKAYAARAVVQNGKTVKPRGFFDPVLGNFLKNPEFTISRDDAQEAWPLAIAALQGYEPTPQELKDAEGMLKPKDGQEESPERPQRAQAQVRRAPSGPPAQEKRTPPTPAAGDEPEPALGIEPHSGEW